MQRWTSSDHGDSEHLRNPCKWQKSVGLSLSAWLLWLVLYVSHCGLVSENGCRSPQECCSSHHTHEALKFTWNTWTFCPECQFDAHCFIRSNVWISSVSMVKQMIAPGSASQQMIRHKDLLPKILSLLLSVWICSHPQVVLKEVLPTQYSTEWSFGG